MSLAEGTGGSSHRKSKGRRHGESAIIERLKNTLTEIPFDKVTGRVSYSLTEEYEGESEKKRQKSGESGGE